MNVRTSYHDRKLVDEVRGILMQDFHLLKVSPREAIEDQLRGRSKRQYEEFIEEIEGVRLILDDAQLSAWWYALADYWDPKISLRAELTHAVEVARGQLANAPA